MNLEGKCTACRNRVFVRNATVYASLWGTPCDYCKWKPLLMDNYEYDETEADD